MKKRGIYLLVASLAAISCYLFEFRSIQNAARKSPFFSEFGSVAWPIPLRVTLLEVFGVLGFLMALLLIAYDFNWRRKKEL